MPAHRRHTLLKPEASAGSPLGTKQCRPAKSPSAASTAIATTDSHRVDIILVIDLLEIQAGVRRIPPKQAICAPRLLTHWLGEVRVGFAKPPRGEGLHPMSSSKGRVSPRRCSSSAS